MIQDCKDLPTAIKLAEEEWKIASGKNTPTTFQEASSILCNGMSKMLISKNHKYGKDNILKFGQVGIFMRYWDKVCRLEQGVCKNVNLGEEGLQETWGDSAGYSLIGILLDKGWYQLPLEIE